MVGGKFRVEQFRALSSILDSREFRPRGNGDLLNVAEMVFRARIEMPHGPVSVTFESTSRHHFNTTTFLGRR
jgi:hypothetical protein